MTVSISELKAKLDDFNRVNTNLAKTLMEPKVDEIVRQVLAQAAVTILIGDPNPYNLVLSSLVSLGAGLVEIEKLKQDITAIQTASN